MKVRVPLQLPPLPPTPGNTPCAGYGLGHMPSAYLGMKCGVRIWLAMISMSWGLVAMCGSLVKSASGLYWQRAVLGLTGMYHVYEGGSCWGKVATTALGMDGCWKLLGKGCNPGNWDGWVLEAFGEGLQPRNWDGEGLRGADRHLGVFVGHF